MTLKDLQRAAEQRRAVFPRRGCLRPTWPNAVPASAVLKMIEKGKTEVFLRNLEVYRPLKRLNGKDRKSIRDNLRAKKAKEEREREAKRTLPEKRPRHGKAAHAMRQLSSMRKKLLAALTDEPQSTVELADKVGYSRSGDAFNAIEHLADRRLAAPDNRNGRMFWVRVKEATG